MFEKKINAISLVQIENSEPHIYQLDKKKNKHNYLPSFIKCFPQIYFSSMITPTFEGVLNSTYILSFKYILLRTFIKVLKSLAFILMFLDE